MVVEDITLVQKVKDHNCEESLKELIARHSALCYNIYSRHSNMLNASGINFEEAIKEKDYVVYKSILSFDPNRNAKFSTWLGNFTRYHCLNLANKRKRHIYVEDQELHYHIDNDAAPEQEAQIERAEFRDYALNILNQLKDPRIKKVFELRYFSESGKLSWSKIGSALGVSIQTAINLHERGRGFLKKKLISKDFGDFI